MVAKSHKNQGLRDWWMQRISASLISIFVLPLLVLWLGGWLVGAGDWYDYLSSSAGIILTILGLLGFVLHARIGLWVVITDYVPRQFQMITTWIMTVYLLALAGWALYLVWTIS